MPRKLYRGAAVLVAAAAAAMAAAPQPPAGWDAVLAGYQGALKKSGIVGSSLMFHPASFDLSFRFFDAASGQTFTDSGSGTCH